jgi:hypothetical protein
MKDTKLISNSRINNLNTFIFASSELTVAVLGSSYIEFEVLSAVVMNVAVLWVIALCTNELHGAISQNMAA